MPVTATNVEVLEFDSEHFRHVVARTDNPAERWEGKDPACLFLLVPGGESAKVHEAERNGFRLMDVRVTLDVKPSALLPVGTIIYPAAASAVDELARIARSAHRITRFYNDPGFPGDLCDDLYDRWVRESYGGWADEVLVAELGKQPVGYITLHRDDREARIGLIAVAEDARMRGIGGDLVRAAVNRAHGWGVDRLTVATQAANIPALRTFEGCGFRVCATDLWFHKWFR